MFEIVVIKKDGGRDYAFADTIHAAHEQAFEFMCAYEWARIEIINPKLIY